MPYGVDERGPFTCIQGRQKPAIIMAQTSVQIHRQPWPSVLHKVHIIIITLDNQSFDIKDQLCFNIP